MSDEDPMNQFDAFREHRAAEQAAAEDEQYRYYQEPEPAAPRRGVGWVKDRWSTRKIAVISGVGALAIVGGVVAFAVVGSSSPSHAASASASSSSASPTPTPAGKHKGRGAAARVSVVSIAGSVITGTTKAGTQVTVNVDASTKFGTKAHPLALADIKPGMTIGVLGTHQGTTITATRIVDSSAIAASQPTVSGSANA